MSPDRTRFSQLLIADNASIRDAMQAIDTNGREMILVRDKSGRIVGLITDGDIRRGLLSGRTFEMPAAVVMTREFFTVPARCRSRFNP